MKASRAKRCFLSNFCHLEATTQLQNSTLEVSNFYLLCASPQTDLNMDFHPTHFSAFQSVDIAPRKFKRRDNKPLQLCINYIFTWKCIKRSIMAKCLPSIFKKKKLKDFSKVFQYFFFVVLQLLHFAYILVLYSLIVGSVLG